tara:strand:+ start:1008 stop:2267 length:1260 start_codon:yes stop_codon:yes gene_type:complete
MNIENIKLDIDFVRSQFPTFKNSMAKNWSFFENAGGSYVPKQVINRLTEFMISTKVQPYADYPMSKIAGQNMDKAINLFTKMINANSNEILIGPSTSSNLYVLSNALKKFINKGDEVIVTNQDHEANISPWRRLVEKGAKIREWKFNTKTGELEIEKLKKLLNRKTKILAVTHCSNIIGSVNNLKLISKLAHEYNVIVIGDGVSYAPHGLPDVKDLDVDFYTFSLYKTYGPHLGLLYGKQKILKKLPNQNHEFLKNQYPYTINPGGPNHEELASLIGIYEYFETLYKQHFYKEEKNIRKKINKLNNIFTKHEENIAELLLDYLGKNKNFRLLGSNNIENKKRAPTISFVSKKKSSKFLSNYLVSKKIATRNDNFYAWRCLKAFGIDQTDGVVRISMVHYNTKKEVENLINKLIYFDKKY